ncbi:MAG TPA: hypothetical protein VGD10_12750 [Allosphingosinicella sp.]|uniref:DUF3617 domain-containing protein n=1 Tax=Allosphingosinicella sp. TaxID=2823234 RepID=UPI002EDACC48
MTTAPASTQGRGQLSALSKLQSGRWDMREIGNARAQPRSICVTDPRILMQIQHQGTPCSRLVIADNGNRATVHYTCPGGDFGRSSIRVDSPRLAIIDTQGIAGGMPFEYRLEARRTASCRR